MNMRTQYVFKKGRLLKRYSQGEFSLKFPTYEITIAKILFEEDKAILALEMGIAISLTGNPPLCRYKEFNKIWASQFNTRKNLKFSFRLLR